MRSVEEYRKRAQECMELAQRAREPDRSMLVRLAEAWVSMADHAAAVAAPAGAIDTREPRAADGAATPDITLTRQKE